ncbi:Nucleotidyltransferase [Thermococcus sp. 4557]|uniref:nucleotidyltransferase domain-containing protein n=1 Tax=Thermococcus sp. (strain CGMCC 1.5172 / 4557) TaxID=1042877 RepID=UPI000219EAAC|nr:nucleotidyltransferase domain-containing protein [Thermococcus sp. 4557]AEK72751.1 Nucleotidyltransferase [Thermococcus sp. 4557]
MPVLQREELEKILNEVKSRLQEILGDDLAEVILFGSYARGEAREDSDVDVLVVVRRRLTIDEHDRLNEVTEKYIMERGLVISLIVYPVSPGMEHDPLIQNVHVEGIKV